VICGREVKKNEKILVFLGYLQKSNLRAIFSRTPIYHWNIASGLFLRGKCEIIITCVLINTSCEGFVMRTTIFQLLVFYARFLNLKLENAYFIKGYIGNTDSLTFSIF